MHMKRSRARIWILVGIFAWGLSGLGGGATGVGADDLAGRLGALDAAGFDPLADVASELGEPVAVEAVIEPGANGGPDTLAVTAIIEEGWHLYSVTQKPGGPLATKIVVASDSPRHVAGPFEPDAPAHVRTVDDVPAWKGLSIEEHAGEVTWRAPLAAGSGEVRGGVRVQLCQDTACLPPRTIQFVAEAVVAPAAVLATPAGRPQQSAVTPAGVPATHQPDRSHVRIEAGFAAAADGSPRLVVRLAPDAGWHLYRPAESGETEIGQGKPTIVAGDAAVILGVSAAEATLAESPELAAAGAVEGAVTLELQLAEIREPAVPVAAVIGFQTCSDTTCDPPTAVRLLIDQAASDPEAAVRFEAAKYGEAAKSPRAFAVAGSASRSSTPQAVAAVPVADAIVDSAASPTAALSLPVVLAMGLLGGLILNLMPCVLPVLGLKLMSFAQQSGRARQEVFMMNLWYCAGLFAVFFALATASVAANIGLASSNLGWGQQFGSVPFKIGMLGVVFAFALSFLGVWELPIPGFIGEKAGHVQSQEGPLGAFLKGVLSTVLATPCSGPFLGPVFGFTLGQPTPVTYAVFGAIALGMSLPYILVGLFPGLVRFLPKPGAWMATFKEVLGFVMLGTVAYLFYLLRQQPDWFVPTFVMLVGIWMGCWWVGRCQETTGTASFGRWLQALSLGGLIALFGFFWLGPRESFIRWEKPFSPARLAELRQSGMTVMVDFSADWCLTCKANLQFAIETDRVKSTIAKNKVVPVLADWTDGSEEIREALEGLGSRSIPVLAIYPAAKPDAELPPPIVLRDLLSEAQVLAALEEAGPSCCPPPEMRAASAPVSASR
jgi:suppressor for copper-sensitivity B